MSERECPCCHDTVEPMDHNDTFEFCPNCHALLWKNSEEFRAAVPVIKDPEPEAE